MRGSARAPTLRALLLATAAWAASATHAAVDQRLCFACHGENGNSTNPLVPSLSAQPAQFIATQLIMFREKRRTDPLMSPIAAPLTNPEITEVSKFFAAQPRAVPPRKPTDEVLAAGRRITEQFNCVACHGATLHGQQHIPRLAGQQADYLRTQLRGFKAGTRFDMDGNMTAAAQALTAPDIDVLADYLSTLE